MLPLGLLTTGEKAEVMEIVSKGQHKHQAAHEKFGSDGVCRMEDMGFRSGRIVEMLNNEGRGPLLVKVDNSRIAIARGIAMKVMVKRKD